VRLSGRMTSAVARITCLVVAVKMTKRSCSLLQGPLLLLLLLLLLWTSGARQAAQQHPLRGIIQNSRVGLVCRRPQQA